MLWRSHDTTVDLDLELARRESSDNPVYYVQYAHARIASILRKAGGEAGRAPARRVRDAGALDPSEKALIKRLLEFPDEVREAAERRAPHRICAYSTAVAADFHAFYRDCQVVGAEGEGVEQFRLALCLLAKRTIAGVAGVARHLGAGADVKPIAEIPRSAPRAGARRGPAPLRPRRLRAPAGGPRTRCHPRDRRGRRPSDRGHRPGRGGRRGRHPHRPGRV